MKKKDDLYVTEETDQSSDDELREHNRADLCIPCPHCSAATGVECTIAPLVHWSRRMKRMLREAMLEPMS